jgi:hypothetical protein
MIRIFLALALAGVSSFVPAAAEAQTTKVYRGATTITPGTPVPAGDGIALACSAAGTLRLVMQSGSTLDLYATQGTAIIDNIAVSDVNAAGTTATCTVSVLRSY